MNVPKIIRMSAVVIGLGAALLFTSSVKAQEIDNTAWSEGSNTAAFDQATSATTASNLTPVAVNAPVLNSVGQTTPAIASQQASVLQQSPKLGWLFPLAMICMAVIAAPALMKSKQATNLDDKNLE